MGSLYSLESDQIAIIIDGEDGKKPMVWELEPIAVENICGSGLRSGDGHEDDSSDDEAEDNEDAEDANDDDCHSRSSPFSRSGITRADSPADSVLSSSPNELRSTHRNLDEIENVIRELQSELKVNNRTR
jgi:hypothetical protein